MPYHRQYPSRVNRHQVRALDSMMPIAGQPILRAGCQGLVMDDPLPFVLNKEMDANDQIAVGYSALLWLTNLLSNKAPLTALGK